MPARIFRQQKSATSSGNARTKLWTLVFEQDTPREIEPLMGWTASGDTHQQVRINFDSAEEAVAYCESRGIAYQVSEPKEPQRRVIAYADNFAYTRRTPWTH